MSKTTEVQGLLSSAKETDLRLLTAGLNYPNDASTLGRRLNTELGTPQYTKLTTLQSITDSEIAFSERKPVLEVTITTTRIQLQLQYE